MFRCKATYWKLLNQAVLIAIIALLTTRARSEITNVTIGVTPSCPYGIKACWSGARAAIRGLKGVGPVPEIPDAYNCTVDVPFTGKSLPDITEMEKEFKKTVGDVYGFRGVEVTINGFLEIDDGKIILQSSGTEKPITLIKLEHKVQYNFRKKSPRQPEPDEKAAYDNLMTKFKIIGNSKVSAEIVGPLHVIDGNPSIEVREFYLHEK